MAFTIKPLYGSSNQAITCTLTSLANNASRQSTAVDNTSNLFEDALLVVKIKSNSGTASGVVNVYVAGTADGGTTYTGGATGSDAAYTQTVPPSVIFLGQIIVTATSTVYTGNGPWSVASAFGGSLPDHWSIIVENATGGTLDASIGSAWYQGVNRQGV